MNNTKVCEFVSKLDRALIEFKKGIKEPIMDNVTLMFSAEEIETLKTVFDDSLQYNIAHSNRERVTLQHKLYENVYFQVGTDLMR